jgi:hypothetical protein
MRRSASMNGLSGCIVIGCGVITSASVVDAGSRPAAITRNSASRSVKIPVSYVPSQTSSAPLLFSFITIAASSTVAIFSAVAGGCPEMMERRDRSDMSGSAQGLSKVHIGRHAPAECQASE